MDYKCSLRRIHHFKGCFAVFSIIWCIVDESTIVFLCFVIFMLFYLILQY